MVPGASGYCRPVEFIDLTIVFGHEPPVNGRWIRLHLLDPEERPLAIAKSPQIRMIAFALVGQEELDIKRLQGHLIERQRTFDIADSQNYVVEHCSLLQNHKGFNGLFTIGYRISKAPSLKIPPDASTRIAFLPFANPSTAPPT